MGFVDAFYFSSFLWVLLSTQSLGEIILVSPLSDSITVPEGSSFDLECQHPPTDNVEWFISGLPVKSLSKTKTSFSIGREWRGDQLISRLKVKDVNRTEAGVYKCSNTDQQKALFDEDQSDVVRVKVKVDTGGVIIVKPLSESIVVPEGGQVEFECQYPVGEKVEWFLSGMRILSPGYDQARFSVQTYGRDSNRMISQLRVDFINRTEAGHYKCSNADLNKAFASDDQSDHVSVRVARINAELSIEGTPNVYINTGEDLSLFCRGDRTSELVWYFNGVLLRGNAKDGVLTGEVNVDKGHRRLALTRHRVTSDHEGRYTCHDKVNKLYREVFVKVTVTGDGMTVYAPSGFVVLLACAINLILASSVQFY